MKPLMAGALALLLLLPMAASARGGSHSSGGSVHVSGYTRANGTYVHDYYRSGPGAGSDVGSSTLSSGNSASNFCDSLGSHEGDQGSSSASIGLAKSDKPTCEFKSVMTDEEIARCR